ncbi:hypothetical protein CAPTEDRAFT_187890 [Capitella teleta]|uniref:Uncharacterized protein n=1 Tax=Capitella teleta TaxID=283909 RepID=R7VA61_CAPTE|nr:hypothetical protein CAPTEDRAFT_187890 [Capitella teleta]|eukprot:ELU13211.1 hypothetical protein CAPTEDRAFT_187890 [Capitella teleta]
MKCERKKKVKQSTSNEELTSTFMVPGGWLPVSRPYRTPQHGHFGPIFWKHCSMHEVQNSCPHVESFFGNSFGHMQMMHKSAAISDGEYIDLQFPSSQLLQ